MKIEDAKELQNIFKSTLNEKWNRRFKSEEQRPRQAVIKLFNEYFLIPSESKHKTKYGKGLVILSPKQIKVGWQQK